MYDLLTRVLESSLSPTFKAEACGVCAQEWKIDGTKLNKEEIDAVRKTAQDWIDLLERMEAAEEEVVRVKVHGK